MSISDDSSESKHKSKKTRRVKKRQKSFNDTQKIPEKNLLNSFNTLKISERKLEP